MGSRTETDIKGEAPVCGRMTRACGRINGYIGNEETIHGFQNCCQVFFQVFRSVLRLASRRMSATLAKTALRILTCADHQGTPMVDRHSPRADDPVPGCRQRTAGGVPSAGILIATEGKNPRANLQRLPSYSRVGPHRWLGGFRHARA